MVVSGGGKGHKFSSIIVENTVISLSDDIKSFKLESYSISLNCLLTVSLRILSKSR